MHFIPLRLLENSVTKKNTVFADAVVTFIYTGISFNFAADANLQNVVYCTHRIFCVHTIKFEDFRRR